MEEKTDRILDPKANEELRNAMAKPQEDELESPAGNEPVSASKDKPTGKKKASAPQEKPAGNGAGNGEEPPSPEVRKHLNESLIQKAREIRNELGLIRERIAKIEESKGQVKESVYQKVSTDYTNRYEETRTKSLEVKDEIDKELAELRHKEADATRKVMEHEEVLEEAQFRHELGEYSDTDFGAISSKEKAVLEQAKAEQNALQEAIQQYTDIFAGAGLEKPAVHEVKPKEAPLRPAPPPGAEATEAPPPATEEAEAHVPPPPNVGTGAPRAVSRHGGQAAKPMTADTDRFSAQAQALVVVYESGREIGQYDVKEELTIGRSPSNEVTLQEPRISRRHAVIRHSGDRYMLIDNNSSNGTYVNGKPISEHILNADDKLQIGSFELVFKA